MPENDHDLPETCPNCGEAYDQAVSPETEQWEYDDEGNPTGRNPDLPDKYARRCSIGTLHPDWPGWNFYHEVTAA